MHGLPAKGVVGTFIFHVVGAREPILMSLFLASARGTRVPIFHIKSAREAHILIRE